MSKTRSVARAETDRTKTPLRPTDVDSETIGSYLCVDEREHAVLIVHNSNGDWEIHDECYPAHEVVASAVTDRDRAMGVARRYLLARRSRAAQHRALKVARPAHRHRLARIELSGPFPADGWAA